MVEHRSVVVAHLVIGTVVEAQLVNSAVRVFGTGKENELLLRHENVHSNDDLRVGLTFDDRIERLVAQGKGPNLTTGAEVENWRRTIGETGVVGAIGHAVAAVAGALETALQVDALLGAEVGQLDVRALVVVEAGVVRGALAIPTAQMKARWAVAD